MIPKDKVEAIVSKHNSIEKELSSGNVDPKSFAEKSKEYGGLNVAFIQVSFAAVCLSPFTVSGFGWMLENLMVSIFLGLFLTGVGLATYWYVVKIITPLSIGTITYLEPVTGVIIGTLILNESLKGFQYFGFGLVIIAGIAQVYLDSK